MGSQELIESLWKTAREKAEGYRAEAEKSAGQFEKEVLARKEDLRTRYKREAVIAAGSEASSIAADAMKTAMRERLLAEKELADRLQDLSRKALTALRTRHREEVFSSLVSELPDLPWGEVRVNSEDRALAAAHFPGADIVEDETVTGGLRAKTKDGTVEVINTFEKRLKNIWDTLLPEMMREIRSELDDDRSA